MGWEEAGDHGLRKEDRSYFLRRAWVCDLPWKLLIRFAAGEAPPAGELADVPADAPPVYHWTGKRPAETTPPDAEDDSAPPRRASLFSRLAVNFR